MNLTHNTEKPLLIFITGASGAGKTTVLKAIEAKLGSDDISINYFDSVGVPSTEEMIKDYGSLLFILLSGNFTYSSYI